MAKKKHKNKVNLFCKVCFLDGTKKLYQFPNDLRDAMLISHKAGELKKHIKWSLNQCPYFRLQKRACNYSSC